MKAARRRRPLLGSIALSVWLVAAALACGSATEGREGGAAAAEGPPGKAPATLGTSDQGRYRIALRPEEGSPPLQRLHAWVARIEDREGHPIVPTRLELDGGMPQHGHGLSTRPRVTRAIGPGEFRIEGVRFHMSGRWILVLEIVGPAGPDSFRLPVEVGP